jgi:uncharacterized membrane protein
MAPGRVALCPEAQSHPVLSVKTQAVSKFLSLGGLGAQICATSGLCSALLILVSRIFLYFPESHKQGTVHMRILFLATSLASANLTLAIELVMALGLTFGAWLAHRRCYRGHAWCQSAIVLLNLLVIATYMVPSFTTNVRPRIPEKLGHSFYGLATAHAILGSAVEVTGFYVILAAGTKILPKQFRLSNLKTGMGILLACWWLVFLLGLATYVRWYVPIKRS